MALSSFAGGRLWGARQGTGRPWVLALPGWGRDHNDFASALAGLDAVALDLPGFGAVPEPPAPWSTAEYAEAVVAVLDDLCERAVVVGHSFGGRVAVRLASDRRVAALVLTGAPLAPPPGRALPRPPLAYRAGRMLHRAGLVGSDRMERLRQKYGSDDYRCAGEVMRGVLVKAVKETSEGAYIPALRAFVEAGGALELVWGEHDRVASLAGVTAGLQGLAGGAVRTTVVQGAGHLLSSQLAQALRDAVLRQWVPTA